MKIDYKVLDDKIILNNVDSFNPEHIFECGQAFRWYREDDGSYTTIAYKKILNVLLEDENTVILNNTNEEDFKNIWIDYFDLNRDYSIIKNKLKGYTTMEKAIDYGYGIRIINQEPFETMISFIISANNQIPRIRKSIEKISENYGEYLGEYKGKNHYSFPNPSELAKVKPEELREIARVGFRDKRIYDTANIVNNREFNIEEAKNMDSIELRKALMELPGIGPKVADCIMLFSFKRSETFPVDVWIKRVMEELYLHEETKQKEIGIKAREIFGEYAGFAQQYLFYYGRENNIGKK